MFGSASVIVPEIKLDKINRVGLRRPSDYSVDTQAIHQSLRRVYLVVRSVYNLLCLCVNALDHLFGAALIAYLLHLRLRLSIVRTLGGNGIGQEIRKTLRGVVRHA